MRVAALIACLALAGCDGSGEDGNRSAGPPEPVAADAQRGGQAAAAAPNAPAPAPPAEPAVPAHPCQVADGRAIAARIKAIGTEPFWAAEVEGRCVTYRTPEDQAGTRVWARFSGTAANGQWSGFLGDRRFILVTRAEPGCSDGMSDRRYPLGATLTIGAEERRGCAEPL